MFAPILLLEDQPFIALDLEEVLDESGHPNHVTFTTCVEASEWLEVNTPSLAIVDPRLSDGMCTVVVRRLSELAVPFIVYSGEGESLRAAEPAFASGHLLGKPALPDEMIAAVTRALNPV
ncbi:response regulator [Rhizobium sp. BK376]|uniref:response regulator n=1 Tax=Rhizobium sp. BK376 TaxID=2512149 RepID=UPI0010D2D1CF|nr:response regulator [Rhizobium sp. BK376]TCR71039.1 response regulator receiver domain-containing protein [Rhizobium sp. BK376]